MVETDVVVVGGGPSGATTALLLARQGHAVVVADRARFPRDKACGEGLMPPGVEVLRRLGLYDEVLATGARPLEGVTYQHVGGDPSAYASFPPPPSGMPSPGLGVRRLSFDAVLVDALRGEPNVTLREGERVTGIVRDGSGRVEGVETTGDDTAGGGIRARVVIGADGLHSGVRAWSGLSTEAPAKGRYGLAGHWHLDVRNRQGITVTLSDHHEWYEAPVGPETLLVSVLSSRSGPQISARTYADAARAAVPSIRDSEPVAPPLGAARFRQRARAIARDRVFLVGDASGYDDPTTGDGLAIGMLLAERLAFHVDDLLSGRSTATEAAARYSADHARMVRERRRLTHLALFMARTPLLSRRAIARARSDPRALSGLLAINCGYQRFRNLSPRDWLALLGI